MKAILFILLVTASNAAKNFGPKKLYTLSIPTEIVSVNVIGKDLLIVGPWYVGQVKNVHWKFRDSDRMRPRIVSHDIPNPRFVERIPSNAFKSKDMYYWVATWGTNDTNGAMFVMKPTPTYSVKKDITVDNGWNYERSQWVDMNKDGRLDCLTARFRGGVGQLIWFNQPADNGNWAQQIIHEGMADGNFVGFFKGGKTYILVAGLQFSTLGLYWVLNRNNNWAVNRQVRHRVIDNYGKFYDVEYVDLNRDGKTDILTTTVNIGNSRGHVLGYEVPNDLQNVEWKRRVLAAGFTGDYSPGKATAFWPNKDKQKTDRPSIFLSGAGAGTLFILTPSPKKSGWGYIRSSLKAGVGMIGIPYIGDIDGDTYPEVFVPQGTELHVFSYDYNAATAEPPQPSKAPGSQTKKPVVYRNPFYRPTTAGPKPRPRPPVPKTNLTRPAAGSSLPTSPLRPPGTTGVDGTGSSGPSSNAGSPPLKYFFPGETPSVGEATGTSATGAGNTNIGPAGGSSGTSSGGVGSSSSSENPVFGLWPVMTNNGPVLLPIANGATSNTGPAVPNNGGVAPNTNTNFFNTPQNNIYSNSQNNNPPTNTNPQTPYNPGNPFFQPQPPSSSEANSPIQTFNDYGWNKGIIPINSSHSNTDNIVPYDDTLFEPQPAIPDNLMLTVTDAEYEYRIEASDACSFENKVLCSLEQLSIARKSGELPEVEWGWFNEESRAAKIEDCVPGQVKWPGYECYNGGVAHTPVKQQARIKGLCCSVLKGARVTRRQFSNKHSAADYCKYNESSHLCTLEDLYQVWSMSSYKDDQWRFFDDENKLAKLVHNCDPQISIWPGYSCYGGGIVTAEANGHVQEKAFCCPNNSNKIQFSLTLMTVFIIITIYYVVLI